MTVIMGDFNANIGRKKYEDIVGPYGLVIIYFGLNINWW